jgi:hypothetical protein
MDNHLILVRFNVFAGNYLQYGQYTRKQMYEGDPSWLDIRLKWFENYLLENLKTQEDKDFWCFLYNQTLKLHLIIRLKLRNMKN